MPFVIVLRDTRVILTLLGWKASWTLFIIVCLREKKKKKIRLSTKQLMLLNCGVGEDSWESLGLKGDQSTQS